VKGGRVEGGLSGEPGDRGGQTPADVSARFFNNPKTKQNKQTPGSEHPDGTTQSYPHKTEVVGAGVRARKK